MGRGEHGQRGWPGWDRAELAGLVREHGKAGIRTSWRGPRQLLDEVPGQTATLWTWAGGVDTVLSVDYPHHTWFRTTIAAPPSPGPSGGPPSPGAYPFSQKGLDGIEPRATSIATLFRQSGAEVIGTAVIADIFTYELRIPALAPDGKPFTGKGPTAWADSRT